jgi:hypothetical protein
VTRKTFLVAARQSSERMPPGRSLSMLRMAGRFAGRFRGMRTHDRKGGVSILIGLVLLVRASVTVGGDAGWTGAGTKNGVTLAFRDDPKLAAREVRATSELPFPAARILSVVCDLSRYKELVPGVTEATLIEGRSPGDYEIYLRYAPRLLVVAARDVVLRVRGASDVPGRTGCSWAEVTGRLAERQGTVRMPLLRGAWTLEALAAGRSRVVYQIAANPGGRIPGWLVRRGAVQALPEVIENVRERLRRIDGAASTLLGWGRPIWERQPAAGRGGVSARSRNAAFAGHLEAPGH